MKKIFTTLAAAALVAVSAQAKLEVSYHGEPLANGATIELGNNDFELMSYPDIDFYQWSAECNPAIESSSFLHFYVVSTTNDTQFCVGNCFPNTQVGDEWVVDRDVDLSEAEAQIHLNYNSKDLPTAKETVKVNITNKDGDSFNFTVVFSTTDTSGVEEIAAASANVAGIYDLQGRPVSEDFRGVAIVVYDNGKAVKQVIK